MVSLLAASHVLAAFDRKVSGPLAALGYNRVGEVVVADGALEIIYEAVKDDAFFSPDASETGSEVTFRVVLESGNVSLWGGTAPEALRPSSPAAGPKSVGSADPPEHNELRLQGFLDEIAARLVTLSNPMSN